ncbi:TrkH family potassium uptake protein [Rhizobiales bacterium L72]|uniref:Trk system potassium uptake protein n=1 Tax=Propylenella binzhouense TaxID=2555902 RepID=A0A964WVF2_9HYPH|nr:TrkH family potassium uptake protein [Propylenella binzhouense]
MQVIGALLVVLGGTMLLPALTDLQNGAPEWRVFVLSSAVTAGTGLLLVLSTRTTERSTLRLKQAFLLTAAVWTVIPAFGAIPFLGLGISYADAFFESASGFTTTGSTVLVGLDELPRGILLWRSVLQWIGGVGIIVLAMIIMPFLGVGGMQLFRAESSDRSEKVLARSSDLVAWIAAVYGVLTLLCTLAYAAAGMTFFDALAHAMTTLSTGGYSTHDASFGHFQSEALEWIAVVFMICGGLPLVLFIAAIRGEPGRIGRDPQTRWFLIFLAAVSFLAAVWLSLRTGIAFDDAMRLVAFNAVSVVTTTGYASVDYTLWGPFAVGLFFMLTFVGGCTGSTAGGIKIYRFVILFQVIKRQFRMLASPSRLEAMKYAGARIPEDVPPSVLAFLTLYVATTAAVTLILVLLGLDFVTAISSAATAISNVGPGLGEIVGPAGNFSTLPDMAKSVLAVAMILGRLELFTVLILLDPGYWRW